MRYISVNMMKRGRGATGPPCRADTIIIVTATANGMAAARPDTRSDNAYSIRMDAPARYSDAGTAPMQSTIRMAARGSSTIDPAIQ